MAPDTPRTTTTTRALLAVLLALICGSPLAAGDALGADVRFALVVGHNRSDDPDLAPLRYADDDALRYRALFERMADDVRVLTELDEETRRLVGPIAVTSPTRAALLAELAALRRAMEAVRARGDRPVLYFVYSGHGNYDPEGRGYVHLEGGRFTTRDLYHHLFEPSGDDPVVLIVDACNAALLVASRGAPSERRPAQPTRMHLESYPNVGVVLASSSVGETHEWGRYLAGVFSHEVRSGLVGPADLDDDGRVTFPELAAFIAAANAEVKNPNVRITPYVRPPLADPQLALVDLGAARFPLSVRVGDDFAGKAYVVDADLVRYADFHKTAGRPFWLALTRPDDSVIVHGDTEYLVPAGTRGRVELEALVKREKTVLAARGAGSEYFERTLFHRPLGARFATRYLTDEYIDSLEVTHLERRPWHDNGGAWGTLGIGVAALAAGAGFTAMAGAANNAARDARWVDDRVDANADVVRYRNTSTALYAAGGLAVAGSLLWFVLDRPVVERRYRPPLSVSVSPTGVVLRSEL